MDGSKNKNNRHLGILIFLMAAIPNPDPREPSPDLSKQEDTSKKDDDPNTNLSGIKDDRTHNREQAQAEQKEKDDEDKPDLSGDINV